MDLALNKLQLLIIHKTKSNQIDGSLCGIVANVPDYNIVVSKFEL